MARAKRNILGSMPRDLARVDTIYKLKVVLVGDISVGKTSLAIRFAQNRFDDTYKQTIGVSFISKAAHVSDDIINFQIWDTAGQERYKSLVPMYLRGAHIAFVVYDVSSQESFDNVGIWLEALRHHGDLVKTVLVANKCDLTSQVDDQRAIEVAQSNGIPFVPASAKSGYNVDKLFITMGSRVLADIKMRENVTKTLPHNEALTMKHTGTTILTSSDDGLDEDYKRSHRKCCKTS